MKKTVVSVLLFISSHCVFAQADVKMWSRLSGSGSFEFCYTVAADHFGNAVIAGETAGSLGGGNAGNWDLFIAKYNSAGTRLWLRQRGTDHRDCIYGVTTDAAGNIYATGYTGNALDGNFHHGTVGLWDFFLMKFDSSGNWQWTKQDGTAQSDEGRAICLDPSGNVFIAGYMRGDFDGNILVGKEDVFVRKYDAAGNRLWTRSFGSLEIDEPFGIACDASGNVFVTGWCDASIEGNPYFGNGDNFLAKYDPNGQRLWLKQWGTANKDTGYSLATDATGNVFVSGYTSGPLYGPPMGNRDGFLAKFDAQGNELWGKQFGTDGHDQGWGTALDTAGNVYLAGETGGSLDGNTHQGGLDILLCKYSPVGDKLWTIQTGTAEDDLARGIAVATNGVVFLTGWTYSDLDGNANQGLTDPFVMKFVPNTNLPPPAPTALAATGVTSNSFTARWSAASTATGYRLDASTNGAFGDYLAGYQDLDVGNVMNRYVTGLIPTATYFYRVRAYNSNGTSGNSATMTVTLPPATPCVGILNSDFEGGFSLAGGGYIANGWIEWEAVSGATVGYDETAIVYSGAHSQRLRVGSTSATSGGVYQRIPVIGGNPYTVSVWIYAGDDESACYLGVDPAGGTNANGGGVVWSSVTTNMAWVQKTWTGTPTANLLTVFYKVASSDSNKRNGYFDDATPTGSSVPPLLVIHRDSDSLILTWPECPAARLEQTDSLTTSVIWTTATNQVSIVGRQKNVTITPSGSAGYYRLVLD